MKKERENELLLKGAMAKVTEILKDFNATMNSTLGDTIKVTSSEGIIERKATLQDTIDFYKNEWYNVVDKLYYEVEIDLEDDGYSREAIKENHKEVCAKLELFAENSAVNGTWSYLEYEGNIQIPYTSASCKDDSTGGTMLILSYETEKEINPVAYILLEKNKKYQVIDKTGEYMQPRLVEI